jgi:Bacterial regulatory helix-turn-helix protein, lysR family
MHQIRYFLAVSEYLNFRRAAEECHVSVLALTRAIQNHGISLRFSSETPRGTTVDHFETVSIRSAVAAAKIMKSRVAENLR